LELDAFDKDVLSLSRRGDLPLRAKAVVAVFPPRECRAPGAAFVTLPFLPSFPSQTTYSLVYAPETPNHAYAALRKALGLDACGGTRNT
jgi:hypothetical protein